MHQGEAGKEGAVSYSQNSVIFVIFFSKKDPQRRREKQRKRGEGGGKTWSKGHGKLEVQALDLLPIGFHLYQT